MNLIFTHNEQINLNVDFYEVASAYSGRVGCMCGCNGTYCYPSNWQHQAGEARGSAVQDDEVSNSKVKTRLNKLLKMAREGDYDRFIVYDFGVHAEKNDRVTAVYFKES